MKIETLPNGIRLVRRYRHARCYAAVWSADTTDQQIALQMSQGDAKFYPYDESSGRFLWGQTTRASYFRR